MIIIIVIFIAHIIDIINIISGSALVNSCAYSTCYVGVKIVSEYDQEIPQSQTADNPVASRGRSAQPSQDTRKTN